MLVTYQSICLTPSEYKICAECKRPNLETNEECIHCESLGHEEVSTNFILTAEYVRQIIKEDYAFYMEKEFMKKEDVDKMLTEV